MEIKTAEQLMRLIVGVRLHYRGPTRCDEFNYMVRARKEGPTARESMIYRDKLNLLRRSNICPLNWAFQEARLMRQYPSNVRIIQEGRNLLERIQHATKPPLDSVSSLAMHGGLDIAIWAAQDRKNIQAFSDALNGGVDLAFPATEVWDSTMRLYPIMRDIAENKFKAV